MPRSIAAPADQRVTFVELLVPAVISLAVVLAGMVLLAIGESRAPVLQRRHG